jgi:hypothetical protein
MQWPAAFPHEVPATSSYFDLTAAPISHLIRAASITMFSGDVAPN